jgi:hypothetical protein
MTAPGTATDAASLRQFLSRLPADPVLPADFADLSADPAAALRCSIPNRPSRLVFLY